MTRLKPDADEIVEAIDELRGASWLPSHRRWWPNFVYHSADITNAANILNSGELLSRNRAARLPDGFEDCASPGIISGLAQDDKDWVRLYFRPLAPTQHANEGIRPKAQYEYNAHMPVPVYLLFRAEQVLPLSGTQFTRGRLSHGAERGEDAAFLRSIDWRKVLHHGPFARQDRDAIINARHAEVLVRDSLSLEYMRGVICRSVPERETLLGMLKPAVRKRWRKSIALERPGRQFFYKRGTFVQSAELADMRSKFTFYANIHDEFRGPFHVLATWQAGGWEVEWEREEYHVTSKPLVFNLGETPRPYYRVRIEFDGALAYQGDFAEPSKPQLL